MIKLRPIKREVGQKRRQIIHRLIKASTKSQVSERTRESKWLIVIMDLTLIKWVCCYRIVEHFGQSKMGKRLRKIVHDLIEDITKC